MATNRTNYDESLVERDEVVFPNTDVIDTEPHYNNFTTIQNALRQRDGEQQMNQSTQSTGDQHRAIRTLVESNPLGDAHSNEGQYVNILPPWNKFTVPVNIQSKKIDGHIFNLTKIVEEIGYNRNSLFLPSPTSSTTKNVSALLNIVLKVGGAHGPLANVWRSRLNDDYFQRWYLEKYHQRSASLIQHNTMSNTNESTTQNAQTRDYRSSIVMDNLVSPKRTNTEKTYGNESKHTYGYDDQETTSSASDQSSYSEIELKNNAQRPPSITSILKKNNGNNHHPNSPKHRVTIQDNYPMEDVNYQTVSSLAQPRNDQHVPFDYQQLIQNHPDVYNDPNPQIVNKPNPDVVTYQQNVSVRYLVPPTPPPPGPLIIREIVPPRAPTPPPLVVKYQEPSPPTPPPLILREAPPPPPPHQETTVITKVLPPEPQPPRRVIVEHAPPLPPKPQPVIIEKWLPYKPAPPREVIYQRVTENQASAEFEPGAVNTDRQRRHSAEFQSNSARVSIPVHHMQRRNSADYAEQEYVSEQPSTTFDQLAWTTHQQILAMQQRGREQLQAHQQWAANQWQQQAANQWQQQAANQWQQQAANQWQQQANTFLQYPMQLTTPSLVVYHPPVTRSYVQTREYQQKATYNQSYVYPYF